MKRSLSYIFISLSIMIGCSCFAQKTQHKIDSLMSRLNETGSDTERAKTYNHLADLYRNSDPKKHMEYAKSGLALSKKNNYTQGMADGYNLVGLAMENSGRFDVALQYYDSSLTQFNKLGTRDFVAKMNLNIANVYLKMTDYKNASKYALNSLHMQEQLHSNFGVAVSNLTLGNIYYTEGDPRAALDHYEIAYRLNRISGKNASLEGAALGNIGSMFVDMEQYDSALYYYRISEKSYFNSGDSLHLGSTYNNLGETWWYLKNADSALYYYRKALSYDYKMLNPYSGAKAMASVGNLYADLNQIDSALHYYRKALWLLSKTSAPQDVANVYWEMSHAFEKQNRYDSALIYERKYQHLNDSISEKDKVSTIDQLKQVALLDKADKDLKISEAAKKVAQEENRRTTLLLISITVFGLLVIAIFFLRYRQKQKYNRELEKKNREILIQKDEITSSIQYAKRIQEAIFPSKEVKYRLFPDAFILLLPRDIVSGDFYWFAEKDGKKLIAAVDCTGHGVPGAFMSMIGNAFLNEIVNEKGITDAGKILDDLRDMVISSLKQYDQKDGQSSSETTRDGMDIALVVIDEKNSTIQYAGANNPLWLLRKNAMDMEEVKGDKQPIGSFSGEHRAFDVHTIKMNKGDSFYIFTDGYADQFGGKEGKKFRYKPLKELFINIGAEPMQTQEKILRDTFAKWKGQLEQVDDVLVIGVRT